ncbi:unnamed protein product [Parnassius apollo]|uniref:(apollo) hypothetical protein n=1 Tax=Parnassius apollo TaxID=110799 RepID=A0A8S3WPW0_PARAO|nr:unnamed protein product [Parnassius apollo]
MASYAAAMRDRKVKPQWERTRRIMALVPPACAPSDSSDTSEDEDQVPKLLEHVETNDLSDFSSEPKSIESSLETLNILDDLSDNSNTNIQQNSESPISPYEEDTVPLTPLMNEIFRPGSELLHTLPTLNSPLLSALPENTRSNKRKAINRPKLVTKKVKKYIRKPLNFKWTKAQTHAAHTTRINGTDRIVHGSGGSLAAIKRQSACTHRRLATAALAAVLL